MNEPSTSSDSGSKLDIKAKTLRRNWFERLPGWDQDGIIKREFDVRHPTDSAKRQALQNTPSNDIPF